MADEIHHSTSKEMDSSELRSQQVIILSKARHYFYLTKDRLLSLSKNSNKKLNNHLSVYIKIVENDLKQCSSDITLNNSKFAFK